MGLAGEDDLYRALGGVEEGLQPLRLRQEQGRPLVGGETPGEPDREDPGIEDVVAPGEVALADPLSEAGGPEAPPHEAHQPLLALLAHPPDVLVRRVVQAGPSLGSGVPPLREDVAVEERGHLTRDPGGGVDPVGDGLDRNLVEGDVGPQVPEQAL